MRRRKVELSPGGTEARTRWWVILCMLLVEFCEQVSFYTILGTQFQFLRYVDKDTPATVATAISNTFSAVCALSGIFGSVIADSYIGPMWLVTIAGFLQFGGEVMITYSAHPSHLSLTMYLFGCFMLLAPGTSLKAVLMTFAAEQISPHEPNLKAIQSTFFSWWYMCINVGGMLAFTLFGTIATSGVSVLGITKEYGFVSAYGLAATGRAIALLAYLFALPYATKQSKHFEKPASPIISRVYASIMDARNLMDKRGAAAFRGWVGMFIALFLPLTCALLELYQLIGPSVSAMCSVVSSLSLMFAMYTLTTCYKDCGWIPDTVVATFLQLVPVNLVANVIFGLAYNTMNNILISQSCQTDTRLFGKGQVNGTFVMSFDCVAILLFTPLLNGLIIPFWSKWSGPPTLRPKMVVGFSVMAGAMLAAAVIELRRRSAAFVTDGGVNILSDCATGKDGQHLPMSDISLWWMLIVFSLIGISEVFVNVTQYDHIHASAPKVMRNLAQGFCFLTNGGLSGSLSVSLGMLMEPFSRDADNNKNHLEIIYFVIMAIQFIGVGLFLFVFDNPVTRVRRRSFEAIDLDGLEEFNSKGGERKPLIISEGSDFRQRSWRKGSTSSSAASPKRMV